MKRLVFLLATCLAAVFIGVGCGDNKGPTYAKVNPSKGKVLASASAEAKGAWEKAMAEFNTNDFAGATMTLIGLRAQPGLTAEQIKVVTDTIAAVTDQMYAAANKGDPAALKSLEELKKMRGR